MKFKKGEFVSMYEIHLNDEYIGETRKIYKHGCSYWKNHLSDKLFMTRKEAAENLINGLKLNDHEMN